MHLENSRNLMIYVGPMFEDERRDVHYEKRPLKLCFPTLPFPFNLTLVAFHRHILQWPKVLSWHHWHLNPWQKQQACMRVNKKSNAGKAEICCNICYTCYNPPRTCSWRKRRYLYIYTYLYINVFMYIYYIYILCFFMIKTPTCLQIPPHSTYNF